MITAIELLEFLTKAQKLFIRTTFRQTDEGCAIILYNDWYGDNDWHDQGVFISNEGKSSWNAVIKATQFYEFDTMNRILDELVEKQKQEEIKAQKRQELLDCLTPEERELLGV